jgi:hypothetical protein
MDSNAVAKKGITLRVNLLVSKRSANAPFRLQSIPITRVQAVPRTSAAAVALAALRRWVLNATTIKKPFPQHKDCAHDVSQDVRVDSRFY